MIITAREFVNLMIGARATDQLYGNLKMTEWLYDRWAIGDNGCHYVPYDERQTMEMMVH